MYVIRLPDGNLRVPVGVVGPGAAKQVGTTAVGDRAKLRGGPR